MTLSATARASDDDGTLRRVDDAPTSRGATPRDGARGGGAIARTDAEATLTESAADCDTGTTVMLTLSDAEPVDATSEARPRLIARTTPPSSTVATTGFV